MNIKNFLIDNYTWLIVILIITIITIIGFLADKNSKNKQKKEQNDTENELPPLMPIQNMDAGQLNNQREMQYQQLESIQSQANNNMGIMYSNENKQMPQPNQLQNISNNQELVGTNNVNLTEENQQTVINTTTPIDVTAMNSPQKVEKIAQHVLEEPIYQPLSEQTTNISQETIPNFSNVQNTNQDISQSINNNLSQNNSNVIGASGVTLQPIQQQIIDKPIVENTPNYNGTTSMPKSTENHNINYGMNLAQPMSNFNQNNATIPRPIPEPKPINAQPIMQNLHSNGQTISQSNYNGMTQQRPAAEPMNQQPTMQNQTITPQPISFVFGPQNNNQKM